MTVSDLFYIDSLGKLAQLVETSDSYTVELATASERDLVIKSLPHYLTHNVIVVDSVNSGTGRNEGKSIYNSVLSPLFKVFSLNHSYFATTSPSSIANLAKNLQPGVEHTVIFISGDTSINEFVNNLPKQSQDATKSVVNIFPIPAGTGNALALSLNLTDITTSIRKLFSSTPHDLNLYQATLPVGSYYCRDDEKNPIEDPINFLVVFSWGFHASLVADSDNPELRKFGLDRFQIAAKNNLSRDQIYPGSYKIDDKVYQGDFSYWVLTPSNRFEPKFVILPKGNILEANLYIISFNTGTDIMEVMTQVYDNGAHINNPKVTYEKVEHSITLNTTTKNYLQRRFCIDGAILALPDSDEQQIIDINVLGNIYNDWKLKILS
jgi:diacylglycerol kinase family enzyme